MLPIGGYLPLTLSDFPGTVAAAVFVRGCTMRCPYCHNRHLCEPGSTIETADVLARLADRRGHLGGVVVSGGEPTMHAGLPNFLAAIRSLGLQAKLDTNGSRPRELSALLAANRIDRVALDVKTAWSDYDRLVGWSGAAVAVAAALDALRHGRVAYELRTTVCAGWHDDASLTALHQTLRPGERWFLQPFRRSGDLPDGSADLRPPDPALLERIRDQARTAGIDCHIR